jgi:hypothetical protein
LRLREQRVLIALELLLGRDTASRLLVNLGRIDFERRVAIVDGAKHKAANALFQIRLADAARVDARELAGNTIGAHDRARLTGIHFEFRLENGSA